MITPAQCKEARQLLGWTLDGLSAQLGVIPNTIGLYERRRRQPAALDLGRLKSVFEKAGVSFEEGGARLRHESTRARARPAVLGEQIREARKMLGWTQDKLAGHAGLSASAVGAVEKGLKRTSSWVIRSIVGVLEEAGVEFSEGEPPRLKPAPSSLLGQRGDKGGLIPERP